MQLRDHIWHLKQLFHNAIGPISAPAVAWHSWWGDSCRHTAHLGTGCTRPEWTRRATPITLGRAGRVSGAWRARRGRDGPVAKQRGRNAKMVIKADNGGSTSSPSPRAATTGSSSSVANAQYPPLVPLTTRTMGSEEFRRNKALWSEFLKRPGCSPRTVKDQAPRPIPRD
jgi:hypothetical protein